PSARDTAAKYSPRTLHATAARPLSSPRADQIPPVNLHTQPQLNPAPAAPVVLFPPRPARPYPQSSAQSSAPREKSVPYRQAHPARTAPDYHAHSTRIHSPAHLSP